MLTIAKNKFAFLFLLVFILVIVFLPSSSFADPSESEDTSGSCCRVVFDDSVTSWKYSDQDNSEERYIPSLGKERMNGPLVVPGTILTYTSIGSYSADYNPFTGWRRYSFNVNGRRICGSGENTITIPDPEQFFARTNHRENQIKEFYFHRLVIDPIPQDQFCRPTSTRSTVLENLPELSTSVIVTAIVISLLALCLIAKREHFTK